LLSDAETWTTDVEMSDTSVSDGEVSVFDITDNELLHSAAVVSGIHVTVQGT